MSNSSLYTICGIKIQTYHIILIENNLFLQRLHCHLECKHQIPRRNRPKQFARPGE